MSGVRLVMEMVRLEGCVEAYFSSCHGWVRRHVLGVGTSRRVHGYHMFAFQTAAVDSRRECTDAIPW